MEDVRCDNRVAAFVLAVGAGRPPVPCVYQVHAGPVREASADRSRAREQRGGHRSAAERSSACQAAGHFGKHARVLHGARRRRPLHAARLSRLELCRCAAPPKRIEYSTSADSLSQYLCTAHRERAERADGRTGKGGVGDNRRNAVQTLLVPNAGRRDAMLVANGHSERRALPRALLPIAPPRAAQHAQYTPLAGRRAGLLVGRQEPEHLLRGDCAHLRL